MSAKAARRARKKERKRNKLSCDSCGWLVVGTDGNHDTAFSAENITWEGVVIVAWCPVCGHEYAS